MSKYTYSNILKTKAKLLKKSSNLKLSKAQEIIVKHYGFSDFHEFTAVAKRNPKDERLMHAALGVTDLTEIIHTNDDSLYNELAHKLNDLMADKIAETNAVGYGLETYECTHQTYDDETGIITLDLSVNYSGEQDGDKTFHGSVFYVDLIIRLKCIDDLWEFQPYDEIELVKIVSDFDIYNDNNLDKNVKGQFEEVQEEHHNKKLALKLGISYDELCELTWEFETDESNDGFPYRHIMVIDEEAPQEVLDKINDLEDGKYVYFEPWEFDSEEPDFQ